MSLLVCWAAFPLVLAVLSLGCGLLVERASGPLPGTLLVPVGLALVIVAASLATTNALTAETATPVSVALAAAGFVLSRRRAVRLDRWALGAAAAVFAAFGAPIVLSGRATFAGYISLDDTSSFLGITDRAMEHGRSIAGLAPSSYQQVLAVNLAHGYPVGSFMPFGIGHVLVREDAAWLFQPTIAFYAAALALCLYTLAAPLVRSPRIRAVAVFVAAQPALLYAYSLWSGVKELAAAMLVALVAALVSTRRLPALAVALAAVLDVLGAAGAVWLLPALVAAAVLARRAPRNAIGAAGLAALLALPAWLGAGEFLRGTNRASFTSGTELGNLVRPVRFLQLFGIWPASDFRIDPGHGALPFLLIALAVAACAGGLVLVASRRAWQTIVYAASAALGLATFVGAGSPWIGGKTYATAGPAVALLAVLAVCFAWERGWALPAGIAAVLLAGGVLWSNVLAYHGVWLAPRDQLVELERIGSRFAGAGPALMTEYQPYGVRHFLRRLDPEGASELRVRPVFLVKGTTLGKGEYADLDRFQLPSILEYRTLVLRRSPAESRPPSVYRLVWRGRFYEVWQRPPESPAISAHLPLGGVVQPGAVPRCADVLALARLVPRGRLVAAPRSRVAVVDFRLAALPRGWVITTQGFLFPTGKGTVKGAATVHASGHYALWVGGSFRGSLSATLDGRKAGNIRDALNNGGQYEPFGTLDLAAGVHRLVLRYSGPDAHPGSTGYPLALGPAVLSRAGDGARVVSVPAADARSLCDRNLDWVEALGPAAP